MKNILITGGAGFIGSRLSLALMARGHQVRVLDNLAPQIHGSNPLCSALFLSIKGKVDFMRGDVTSEDDLLSALEGVDTVVHLAAETGTGQSMYAIRHYTNVNVVGTALLLDLIANRQLPVSKVVVASSRAIYGEGKYRCASHGVVYPGTRASGDMSRGDFEVHCPHCHEEVDMLATDEETPARPASVYGISKLNQEQMVLTVGQSLGISAIAYRYQNVFGPGQSLSNPYTGILSIFSTRIRHGRDINIFEDGKESRDFVFVDDVVEATMRGIEHEACVVNVFNVGSGVATDVHSVALSLQRLLGQEVPTTISGQFRVGDIRHNAADLGRIQQAFGFQPSVGFDEGLARFVRWVQGEALHEDRYEASLTEMRAKGLFK